MSNFETIDPYTRQHMNETLNAFIMAWRNYPAEAIANLLRNDFQFTSKTVEEAFDINDKRLKEEEARQAKATKEAQLQRIEMEKPDVKFSKLYNAKNADSKALYEYCAKHDLEELKAYFQQLTANQQHFHSIFHGQVHEATEFLHRQIALRECGKQTTSTKSETPIAKPTQEYSR